MLVAEAVAVKENLAKRLSEIRALTLPGFAEASISAVLLGDTSSTGRRNPEELDLTA